MILAEKQPVLLSIAFFGPIYYFWSIANAEKVYIEKHENYSKQTWRNRCRILAANGPVNLVVPIEKGRSSGLKITDVHMAWQTDWQRQHWQSIVSAYKSSPFFDYYADELYPFFHQKYTFLFDYNIAITRTLLDLLRIEKELNYTPDFEVIEEPHLNFREKISPKVEIESFDPDYSPEAYTQVFEDKFSFIPNLSILDLLFCVGPQSISYLR